MRSTRVVRVSLGQRSYSIQIGRGLLRRLGQECQKLGLGSRCALITDRNVGRRFAKTAERSLCAAGFDPIRITVPAGEPAKRLEVVHSCYDQLTAHHLERGSFVVALGGGVVGDLAGFVAATYLRGIPFVQVPTTLLAHVDSSVGGKVGVNLEGGKNLVGAFHQPKLVLCDLDTLLTLPKRELRAGLAEVIKYGVIYDARLFRNLERDMARMAGGGDRRHLVTVLPVSARSPDGTGVQPLREWLATAIEAKRLVRAHVTTAIAAAIGALARSAGVDPTVRAIPFVDGAARRATSDHITRELLRVIDLPAAERQAVAATRARARARGRSAT